MFLMMITRDITKLRHVKFNAGPTSMETSSLLQVFSGLRGGGRDAHLEMQTMVTTLQNELQIRPPRRACTRTRLFLFIHSLSISYVYILNEIFEALLHKTACFGVVLQNFLGAICRGGFKDLYGHGIVYTKFSGQIGSKKAGK